MINCMLSKTSEPLKLIKRIKPRKLMTNKNLHSKARNNTVATNKTSTLKSTNL